MKVSSNARSSEGTWATLLQSSELCSVALKTLTLHKQIIGDITNAALWKFHVSERHASEKAVLCSKNIIDNSKRSLITINPVLFDAAKYSVHLKHKHDTTSFVSPKLPNFFSRGGAVKPQRWCVATIEMCLGKGEWAERKNSPTVARVNPAEPLLRW